MRASTESNCRSSRRRRTNDTRPSLAVEVPLEVEEIGLDQDRCGCRGRRRWAGDRPRWPPGARSRRAAGSTRRRSRRPAGRCRWTPRGWRSGSPARTAPAVAVDHRAPHLVGAAQQRRRAHHVPGRHQGADAGRGHRGDGPRRSGATPTTSKPCDLPKLAQQGHVAPCGRGRSGSPPPPPPAGPRGSSTSTSRDEVLGRSRRPGPGRRAPPGCARCRSRPAAPASGPDRSAAVGADSGRTTLAGWRSKVTTTGESPAASARATRSAQQGTVPQVHAVVGTDGDGSSGHRGRG